jgi:predicted permease
VNALMNDLKYGLRTLAKSPGFAAIAILTLALGIGVNTAIFSVLHAVVLRRLPFDRPEQLVQLWEDPSGKGSGRNSVSGGVFADWRQQSQSFQQISALWRVEANLTGGDQPERLSGAQVSTAFFDLLGVRPVFGRTFLAEEERPGHEQVVILGHSLWQRRFGARPGLLGQTLSLDGRPYTVVGILPAGFEFLSADIEYWTPFGWGSTWWHQSRENNRLRVFARLKAGVTIDQARSEMQGVTDRLRPVYPGYKKEWGVTLDPLRDSLVGGVRPPLLALMGAAGFVLLIACVNVANLVLVRAASRQRELGVRVALGAGHWRLMQQLLAEGLVLALAGGLLGGLLAFWTLDLLVAACPQDLPRLAQVRVDGRVLAFSLVLSVVTGLVCGLVPAWNALRLGATGVLKEAGRGPSQGLSRALVAMELALALMLLGGAGLFARSFQRLYSIDPGFDSARVVTFQLKLPESKYPTGESRDRFFRDSLERIATLPGVAAAGASTGLPLEGGHDNGVVLKGRPGSEYFGADYDFATAGYFQAMRIGLLKGRLFTEADSGRRPVVTVVNEAFVRQCHSGKDPIGQHIIENGQVEMEIIGVVADVRGRSLAYAARPQYYKPMAVTDWSDFHLFVQTAGDPLSAIDPVRKAVFDVDPDQPIARPRTMAAVLSGSISGEGFLMALTGGFSLVAVALAAIGVYGVMAYAVDRRTQEIGVRLALGAQQKDILSLILRQGIVTAAVGLALGLAGTWVLGRLLKGLLFEIGPMDPVTIMTVVVILALVAALACVVPARRAAKIDPMEALRCE